MSLHKNTFVGIDPGITGGISVLNSDGSICLLRRFNGRRVPEVLLEVFDSLELTTATVAMERVHARPGQGVVSMFTFGTGYGVIQGWLEAKCIKFELYTPQSWQRSLPVCSTPKDRVKKWALKVYTEVPFIFAGCRVIHQGVMDATAIANYHLCLLKGQLPQPKNRTVKKRLPEMKF